MARKKASVADGDTSQAKVAKKKPFACTFPGCDKSFQRKEHLNRHNLNHAPKHTYCCEKCGKEFYRRDLYNRHEERHKRGMWFRRSGNLSANAQTQIARQNQLKAAAAAAAQSSQSSASSQGSTTPQAIANPQPPQPEYHQHLYSQQIPHQFVSQAYEPSLTAQIGYSPQPSTNHIGISPPTNDLASPHYGYRANGSTTPANTLPPPIPSAMVPPPQNQPQQQQQQPQQQQHFTTYTSPINPGGSQGKLPSVGGGPLPPPQMQYASGTTPMALPGHMQAHSPQLYGQYYTATTPNMAAGPGPPLGAMTHANPALLGEEAPPNAANGPTFNNGIPTNVNILDFYGLSNLFQDENMRWLFEGSMADHLARTPFSLPKSPSSSSGDATRATPTIDSAESAGSVASSTAATATASRLTEPTPPPDAFDQAPSEEKMWDTVRHKLIKCLFQQELTSSSNSPLESCTLSNTFSLDLMNTWITDTKYLRDYFYDYFEIYHDHFPIIHKPTFMRRPDKIHPLLMIAIATLGTAFAPEEHYNVSVKLHERLRWLIFSHNDLVNPPLWVFQSVVLLQAFEKMLSKRTHHELAAAFHGAMVILLRRSQGYFNSQDEERSDDNSLATRWKRWIEMESMKRVYYLAFIMDAQHVALFGHVACMSANEILFELPCIEAAYEAETAEEWNALYSTAERRPTFLSGLKNLLMLKPFDPSVSNFSKLVLLHGLFSIVIHLHNQKGQTLGVMNRKDDCAQCRNCGSRQIEHKNQPMEQWKVAMTQAIHTWSNCVQSPNNLIAEACQPLNQMAHVTLYLSNPSVLDILVYANYPSLIGRKLAQRDFIKAERAVTAWSKTSEAILCVRHALILIQQVLNCQTNFYSKETNLSTNQTPYCASIDKIALRPWCLFISTLIVWAFHSTLYSSRVRLEPPSDDLELWAEANRYIVARLQALESPVSPREQFKLLDEKTSENINSLILGVQKCLKGCRWEMLEQAYITLGELL
ncbi:hypothetical protein TRVA0_011S00144 [Trichomonascus vanleenenianus]|uniref:C2H2 finger domain transcription factor n=1 Tax=Trichomonascus vanleenenianus TaxID=2268995 RepID=UPI003ECA79B1